MEHTVPSTVHSTHFERQRAAVRRLRELIADRAEAEVRIKRTYETGRDAIEREYEEARAALDKQYKNDTRSTEQEFRAKARQIKETYESELARLELEYESAVARITEKAEVNERATKAVLQEALWLTETVFEASEPQPREQFLQICKGIDGRLEELQLLEEKANLLLKKYRQPSRQSAASAESSTEAPDNATNFGAVTALLDERLDAAKASVDALARMFVPRFFQALWPLFFIIVIALVGVGVGVALRGWRFDGVLIDGIIASGAALALLAGLYVMVRSRISPIDAALRQDLAASRGLAQQCRSLAERLRDRHLANLMETRDRDLATAHEKYEPILVQIRSRRDHHLQRLHESYPRQIEEHKQKYESDRHQTDEAFRGRIAAIQEAHDRDARSWRQNRDAALEEVQLRYESDWSSLESRWKTGMAEVYAALEEINSADARLFPEWNDPSWRDWQPPFESAPFIHFGRMHVDLTQNPGGLPQDERLHLTGPAQFTLPAMMSFPEPCSMLIQTGVSGAGPGTTDGRDEAVRLLQAVMFRLLTAIPPGKVRFTIIDPVGLGQNFAGFMHLADYDGAYVTDRIWTEDRHIEQRLLDLTEHMENVIQKYLRNQYETIAEYNVDAGEIAEPYRFLVIANFPVNFTETAARRLASIISSGSRCGVYTLITADARLPLPPGFQMSDLERNSVKLQVAGGHGAGSRFVLKDEDFEAFPLTVDEPPTEEFLNEKLHQIGESAKDLSRVEVPFEVIAPNPDEFWTGDATQDLSVALGRAGATKLQKLTLGVGTSQHALVAGKTGSGKSTLLHALITNLALWYSPDEVEFYLVDFKKGVEFKTYATHGLPHARAVAIESDREFGLSVLQRLDAELKHRGNLYRELGVQDLAGFRRASAGIPALRAGSNARGSESRATLPRTLLIIDEFQELFVEDDKIAQDAALLLDRLVRQGRAFGMHVLLGSQTLGGAYSLARSTINQMAVRIALQCSEADSYLILSDDNAAARLLSRPGEAIYNDASGMIEGNNPFQVVWLPDEKRDHWMRRVNEIAKQHGYEPREPQIVFEGNVPAEVERNHMLQDLLHREDWPELPSAATAWLGEAIAIKDPTAAVFRRQAGNNLIMVGQREEAALAMIATSLISLAAQYSPVAAKFYVFDGSPPDSPQAGYLERVAQLLPHGVQVVAYRDVATAIDEVTRNHLNVPGAPTAFLFIYGLQRYRMLRQEEEWVSGYSSSDEGEAPKTDKQFGAILREGPHAGVHTIAWCDTANNLSRALDRQSLKEFEIRVLFQMSATDSSNLIDAPFASKLGMHRALFFSEEQGHLEKFRPYAVPDVHWLNEALGAMRERSGSGG